MTNPTHPTDASPSQPETVPSPQTAKFPTSPGGLIWYGGGMRYIELPGLLMLLLGLFGISLPAALRHSDAHHPAHLQGGAYLVSVCALALVGLVLWGLALLGTHREYGAYAEDCRAHGITDVDAYTNQWWA